MLRRGALVWMGLLATASTVGCALIIGADNPFAAPPGDASPSTDAAEDASPIDAGDSPDAGALNAFLPSVIMAGDTGCALYKRNAGKPSVYCWGSLSMDPAAAVPLVGSEDMTQLAGTSSGAVCGVRSDGGVACAGANGAGELGNKTMSAPSRLFTDVALPKAATEVRAGARTVCARLVDGSVYCWGDNASATLGDGKFAKNGEKASSVPVLTLARRAVSLGVGGAGTACAITTGRSDVECWGINSDSQLGHDPGVFGDQRACTLGASRLVCNATPAAVGLANVLSPQETLVRIWPMNAATCVVTSRPRILCWGSDRFAQVSSKLDTPNSKPVPIFEDAFSNLLQTEQNASVFCYLDAGARLSCRGDDSWGQMGPRSQQSPSLRQASSPPRVLADDFVVIPTPAVAGGVVAASAGDSVSAAMLADGRVVTWGEASKRALGHLPTSVEAQPLPGDGGTNSVARTPDFVVGLPPPP